MPLGLIVLDDFVQQEGLGGDRAGRRPGARPRARDRPPAVLHQACGHQEHRLAHRRRALHGGALLRSRQGQFQDFEPFWEFVSGPLHAGTFGPGDLDNTFGPAAEVREGAEPGEGQNLPPPPACSSSATSRIDGRTEQMTVTLKDVADADLCIG